MAAPQTPDVEQAIAAALNKFKADVSITSDIGAVANAITEVMKFLQTDAGQKSIDNWINNAASFNATVAKGWDQFIGWFKR